MLLNRDMLIAKDKLDEQDYILFTIIIIVLTVLVRVMNKYTLYIASFIS